MNQEVFTALAERARPRRRGGARHDRVVHRLDAAARRRQDAASTPTAARSARSAAAATRTTRSGKRERRSERARPLNVQIRAHRRHRRGVGLICGGQMEVFIEPVEPSPDVYIFGAGHVGYFLGRMAHETGFRVHVDRRSREVRQPRALRRRRRGHRRRHPDLAADPRAAPDRLRGRSSRAGTSTISTRCARSSLDAAALRRADRQPRQGQTDLRRAARRRHPPDTLQRRPCPDRPGHRRHHPAGDRCQHPGRAHRRQARKIGESQRGGRQHALGGRAQGDGRTGLTDYSGRSSPAGPAADLVRLLTR